MEETLSDRYRQLSDDALLQLASDRSQLTEEALAALDAELSTRRLKRSDVIRVAEEQAHEEKVQTRKLNPRFVVRGFGTEFYGHADSQVRLGSESYIATLFVILLWIPTIPLGTYRVIRSNSTSFWSRSDPRVLDRLPLAWSQVFAIWLKSLPFVFLLLWIFHRR